MGKPEPNIDFIRKALLKVLLEIPTDSSIDLFEEGYIDSLSLMDVIVIIENTFSISIEPKYLKKENFKNLNIIAETVEKMVGGK